MSGGCTDCGNKGGCDVRKGEQGELLDELIARLYPTRTWGRPDDEARFGAGISRREAMRLSRAVSEVARAPVFFQPGAEEDLCDFVYVLCVGRQPSLVELRERGGEPESESIDERHLRICLSSVARVAAVQEVRLTIDGGAIVEAPRAGVFDPILLDRTQKIVALLEASDVRHLDFGLLDLPLADARAGDYVERYGVEPCVASFLFYAQPPTTATITQVAASRAIAR